MIAIIWTLLGVFPLDGNTTPMYSNENSPVQSPDKEGDKCCAYSLQLINLYDKKIIKMIRVSAMCETTICCADPDAWAQGGDIPNYVDWYPADNSAVPYGNAIDNEFLIFLSSETDPHNIQVEWFDIYDNIICRQTIEIACNGHFKEDEDWTQYTTRTSLDDKNLFVFAVREEDEDEEGCDPEDDYKRSSCTFDYNITCLGINTYHVTMVGPSEFDSYTWTVNGPTTPTLAPTQNPTMDLTVSGVYSVNLLAINSSTLDTCESTNMLIIPGFSPSFTTVRQPCGFEVAFTAQGAADPLTVSSYTWQCTGKPDFPTSGSTIIYDFGAPGSYTVELVITDIYGCTHPIVQTVVLTTECHPGVEVKEYALCPEDCHGVDVTNINVTFTNLSTGGICPIQYIWDFGDGQQDTTNETQINHSHIYQNVKCKDGATYQLSLTMIDNSTPQPCSTVTYIQVVIEPCEVGFDIVVCPDGKVICQANVPGEWTLPPGVDCTLGFFLCAGGANCAPWPFSSWPDEDGYQDRKVLRLNAGTHQITFKGHCPTGGTCTITKTFDVILECCAKNDAHRPDPIGFSEGGKDYRMKHNMVQRQLPLIHHIKVKTKLKVHKTIIGIGYWKGSKADEIEASHNGTIYKRDTHCNCKVPSTVSQTEINYNKTKAKYRQHINGRFRSRTNSLISTHRVVKGGSTVTANCYLGIDCDEFCWLTDWF